jgi:hypothetical protein
MGAVNRFNAWKNCGRFGALGLVCATLFSCVTAPVAELPAHCDPQKAFRRGVEDGEANTTLDAKFFQSCPDDQLPVIKKRYRNGYVLGKARAKARQKNGKATKAAPNEAVAKESSAPSWVCEVEASSKVFTGVGQSEAEALKGAQDTCGAHFQAKECSENLDCRQSL